MSMQPHHESNDDPTIPAEQHPGAPKPARGPNVTLIVLGVVALLAVIFFFQNNHRVKVTFWVVSPTWTVRWTILLSILVGVLIDRLVTMWWHRRQKKRAD